MVVCGVTCCVQFADFDDKVSRERTVDLPNHLLGGDWGSAEHASKTSARICTQECGVRCVAKRVEQRELGILCFSNSDRRSQLAQSGPI